MTRILEFRGLLLFPHFNWQGLRVAANQALYRGG